MSKSAGKIFLFLLITSFCLLVTTPIHAAEPGLNLINNIKSIGYVPNTNDINWLVYTPGSPEELNNLNFDANNLVIRIHSAWTDTGKLMLGLPNQQQQVATSWCQSLNTLASKGKKVFVEPFNELEHDYERLTPQGGIGLDTAIIRANNFIGYLNSCLASSATIISPALDPQSADFATTSQAFSRFNIISCHPYRNNTINACTSGPLSGKQYLFTEIGVDKNGVKYDNCSFIEQFCQEDFIQNLNNISGLMAYFLFTFSPGNYDGSWQLTSPQVVSALKGQCTDDLIQDCDSDTDSAIDKIVQTLKNKPDPGKVAPVPDRGISKGPLPPGNTGFIQSVANKLKALFNRQTSNLFPFAYKDTDQYIEDGFINSGDLPDMIKINQPSATILDQVGTISSKNTLNLLGVQDTIITGYTNQEYADTIDYAGPGQMYSVYSKHYDFMTDKAEITRDFFDLQSGISVRQTANNLYSDSQVDSVLCQLAASADPNNIYFQDNPDERLFDEILGYLSPDNEESFIYNLSIDNPFQGPGIVDRTRTENPAPPVPIRIGTVFCTNKDVDSFLTKCDAKGFGKISSSVCSGTPDWLKQSGLEGAIFRTFYPRLLKWIIMLSQNASAKGFLERCQEQEPEDCDKSSGSFFSDRTLITSDFGDISPEDRTYILDQKNGTYNKKRDNKCFTCRTTIVYFPNATKANQVIKFVGKMTTPYNTHQNLDQIPTSLGYSQNDIKSSGIHNIDPKAPMGMNNPGDKHQDEHLRILDAMNSFFSRKVDIEKDCTISYTTDDEGNHVPANVCQGEKRSLLETILYVPPQIFEFINYSENYYDNLTPYNLQTKIDKSIKKANNNESDHLTNLTKAEMISGNQMGGLLTNVKEYLNRKIEDSGRQLVPDTADTLAYGKSLAVQAEVQALMFTPYNWQNKSTTADTAQTDSLRPQDNPSISKTFNPNVLSFCDDIKQAATSKNLDPSLIAALISVESNGNPGEHSNCGAIGLMQVMPNDPQKYGDESCLSKFDASIFANRPSSAQLENAQYNIEYGTSLLSGMISYWGSLEAGLTHYGPVGYDGYAQLIFNVQSQNPTACQ